MLLETEERKKKVVEIEIQEQAITGRGCSIAEISSSKNMSVGYLESLGLTDTTYQNKPTVSIPYYAEDGKTILSTRYRVAMSGDRFRWRKGDSSIPYGIWKHAEQKQELPRAADYLIIVEGESDCWSIWKTGYCCIGIPGASTVACLNLEHVQDFRQVYIWQENDEAGSKFPAAVKSRLEAVGYTGSIKAISRKPYKDPSEVFQRLHKCDELSLRVELDNCISKAVDIVFSDSDKKYSNTSDLDPVDLPRLKWDSVEYALRKLGKRIEQVGHGQYMAQCPAHRDHTPSLSITVHEDGKCLLNCFAGCGFDSIVSALGLSEEYEDAREDVAEKKIQEREESIAAVRELQKANQVIEEEDDDEDNKCPIVVSASVELDLPKTPTGGWDLSPLGACRAFSAAYGSEIRYAHGWGWLMWTDKKWEIVQEHYIHSFVKHFADQMYEVCAKEKRKKAVAWAKSLRSPAGINAMLELAKSEPEILSRIEQFDVHKDLLNVGNGIVNLKTGELLPHDPKLCITHLADIDYSPDAKSELWESIVLRAMNNDVEMVGFLQHYFGYCLTGHTGEQCFIYPYGTGANSKSTIVEAVMSVMGDYATKSRTETILASKQSSGGCASPEIAELQGKRMVVLAEIEEGGRLAESRIKDLTGGDTVNCRRLYQDSFSYRPEFKMVLYGNHRLDVRGTDEGIWRRVRMIPFNVRIPESERIQGLAEILQEPENKQAILTWCIQGAMQWYRDGLQTPTKVLETTNEYRADCDTFGLWLDECCVQSPSIETKSSDLHGNYKSWAYENGEAELSQKAFAMKLKERGFEKISRRDGKFYKGISIKEN